MDVKLVMFKEDGQRKDFALSGEVTTIGRKEDCELRVPVADVSRKHAQITVGPDGVVLKDLGSSNGTFVNNKRVTELTLKAGDRVVVGPVVFTVQIDGQPADVRPVKTRLTPKQDQGAGGGAAQPQAEPGGEIDPISALEALAGESGEEENKP